MRLRAHGKHRKGAPPSYAKGGFVSGPVPVVLGAKDGCLIPARLMQLLREDGLLIPLDRP